MLHYFLRYELGFSGIIGYLWKDIENISLFWQLALIFVYVFIPYILGSINTAIIVSKKLYHDDIRNYGSGNAGFSNVMRVYGRRAAIITFVGDLLKTFLAVFIGWCVFGYLTAYIAGFACFLGHIFPVFYNFKGGKGIVCLASMLIMLDWRLFVILLAIFILSVMCTKYISFGSVLGSMLFPIILNRMNNTGYRSIELIALACAVIVIIKHRANLKRIFEGTESKFEFKKSKKLPDDSEAE